MPELPPEVKLTRLANAYQLSRAVQVAASLGLGRLLREGKRSVGDLAAATETREDALARLLRFLAEIGVVEETGDDEFGPNELSERLHLIDNVAQGEESWAVWGALPQALRSGRSPFAEVHGAGFYEYLNRRPEQMANWTRWNDLMGTGMSRWLAEALDLEGHECVVDVGGGQGALLVAILERHPNCRGILFDLPGVVGDLRLGDAAADRCEIVAGDVFDGAPRGGDVYVVSRVLFNWNDGDAVRLLASCREAMGQSAVLKVVEPLMPPAGDPRRRSLAASDLQLFLTWEGRHRTREEMTELFTRAGLDLVRVVDPGQPSSWQIAEGRPV